MIDIIVSVSIVAVWGLCLLICPKCGCVTSIFRGSGENVQVDPSVAADETTAILRGSEYAVLLPDSAIKIDRSSSSHEAGLPVAKKILLFTL